MSRPQGRPPRSRDGSGGPKYTPPPAPLVALALLLIAGSYFAARWFTQSLNNDPHVPSETVSILPYGPQFTPDVHGDIVLAGSNTIGGHLAVPLLAAFAKADGDGPTAAAQWLAPSDTQEISRQKLAAVGLRGDKLDLCTLNAKPSEQRQVTGAREHLVAIAPGSGCGAPLLQAGMANVAMLSRPIKDDEKKQYASLGPWTDENEAFDAPSRREHVIAMDGLAIIANPANKPDSLTKNQIYRIFTMANGAANWREFGGPNLPIRLYSRDQVSGTYDTFKDIVLHGEALRFAQQNGPGAHALESTEALVKAVMQTPGAIGYVGLEYADEHPELVIPVAECGLKYKPVGAGSDWMIKTEDYPLARRLFLYTPDGVRNFSPKIHAFIEFVKSPLGQAAVAKAHFVSLDIDAIDSAGEQGNPRRTAAILAPFDDHLARKYVALTVKASQLTATIRFGFNQSSLDARARDDLQRIVAYMKLPPNSGASLTVAGFADGMGTPAGNLVTALGRAHSVANFLARAGVPNIMPTSFGGEAPVGCNGEADIIGRAKNRRVELWLSRTPVKAP